MAKHFALQWAAADVCSGYGTRKGAEVLIGGCRVRAVKCWCSAKKSGRNDMW